MTSPLKSPLTVSLGTALGTAPSALLSKPLGTLDAALHTALDVLAGDAPDRVVRANELLHAALAVAAGMGALCTMPAAVRAVHQAEDHLAAGRVGDARTALTVASTLIPAQVPMARPDRPNPQDTPDATVVDPVAPDPVPDSAGSDRAGLERAGLDATGLGRGPAPALAPMSSPVQPRLAGRI